MRRHARPLKDGIQVAEGRRHPGKLSVAFGIALDSGCQFPGHVLPP
jgi:hypothetical protein